MGVFAVSKGQVIFSTFFGICLFVLNFVVVFTDFTWDWQHIVPTATLIIIYMILIAIAILEPTSELKHMTKEE